MSIVLNISVNAQNNIQDSTKLKKEFKIETSPESKYKPTIKVMQKASSSSNTNTVKAKQPKMATSVKPVQSEETHIKTSTKTRDDLLLEIQKLKLEISSSKANENISKDYIKKLEYALQLKLKQLKEFKQ